MGLDPSFVLVDLLLPLRPTLVVAITPLGSLLRIFDLPVSCQFLPLNHGSHCHRFEFEEHLKVPILSDLSPTLRAFLPTWIS